MAFRFLNLCKIVKTCVNHGYQPGIGGDNLLKTLLPVTCSTRTVTFFNERPAEFLWKSVTSVSNAGKRRGRAKATGKKMIKDLNKGQIIGVGKINIQWPGLNVPVIRGRELVRQAQLPEDSTRQERLIQIRESMGKGRRMKQHPLERGWSGGKLGGRKLGPPDPIGEDKFEGFETWILEAKVVNTMTGNMGRKKSASAFVVAGNGNGLVGFALAKAPDTKTALRKAKNKTILKLMYINRYREHTVLHDFFTQFGKTKIFVTKMHEGYGLVCHRAIRECCKAIGIKDIHAKVEGSMNYQHITKAFFIGLLQQKTHQQLAEEKQLHLVEFRKENQYLPNVVASPTRVRKPDEIKSNECLDFNQYVMNEKIVLKRKKPPPFYINFDSYARALKKREYLRNQDDVRIRLCAEYGELRSFMTDKYPEAKPKFWSKRRESEENVE